VLREADLTNRLSNPDEKDNQSKKEEEVKPTSDGGEALRNFKPIELGGEEDKQYAEAVKILKDIDRYQIN
jgi:carboxyl-terminal processing protease